MHRLLKLSLRLSPVVVLALALLIGGLKIHKQSAAQVVPPQEPLPQDPFIQVYFNQAESEVYIEPYRATERLGNNLEQVIIDAIAQAQVSVDVAAHELRLPGVAQALRDRHQASVRVRVIVENTYSRPWSSLNPADVAQLDERSRQKHAEFVALADRDRNGQVSESERREFDALVVLQTANIPWIDDTADGSKGSGLMHHKFLVIDGKTLVTGSANLTTSDVHGDALAPDSRGNANNLLVIQSPAIAALYTQEFEWMWGDGPGRKTDSVFGVQKPYRPPQRFTLPNGSAITVQFSPTSSRYEWSQSVNGLIDQTLATTQQTADLALFVFSEQALGDRLQTLHRQGRQIRALIDPSFAYRDYSEGLDLLGVALPNNRCQYEANNQPWAPAIATVGTPGLARGDLLHHKFAVMDDRRVITGSHNWSDAANAQNDENTLVIESPTVAAHYAREFDRLYRGASLGLTPSLQQKVQERQQRCP